MCEGVKVNVWRCKGKCEGISKGKSKGRKD